MFAFYGNPDHRRELWRIWLDGPDAEGAPESKPPPSLELHILGKYFDEASPETAEAPDGESDADESPDRAGLRETATGLLRRLDDWPSLESEAQLEATLEIFCLATVLDDPGILQEAGSRVPELREEYAEVLGPEPDNEQFRDKALDSAVEQDHTPRPAAASMNQDGRHGDASLPLSAMDARWREVLLSLAVLASEAAEDTPSLKALDRLRQTVDDLKELEEGLEQIREADGATAELRLQARALLEQIESDPACEEVDPEELDRLRGAWLGIPALDAAGARAETERLQGEVSQLVENLRRSDAQHREVEDRLDTLRASRPSDRQALRAWRDERDDLREEATRRRRERRTAEDALIEALAPSFEGGEAEPAENETTPPAVSDADPPSDGDDDRATDSTTAADKTDAAPVTAEDPAVPGVIGAEDPQPADDQPVAPLAPDGDLVEAVPETAEPGLHADARGAIARALAAEPPRLAYATQVCRLLEELGIDAGQPRGALLEAALYADRFARPNGRLSAEYELAIADAPSAKPLTDREPDSIDAEALIAFAAAMPAVLLAPYSGATSLLQDLVHEGLDPLYRFAQAIASRSWEVQKAQIDAETLLLTARDQATHKDALSGLLQDVDAWREGPAKSPLSYTPANKVWRALSTSGELGRLIEALRSQGGHKEVRRLLVELEDESELRKIVDRLAREVFSHGQSVDTKIFRQFKRHLREPLELARRYLSIEAAPKASGGHRKKVIDDLVAALRRGSPTLQEALGAIAAEQRQHELSQAASSVALRSLRLVEQLVDPGTVGPQADEPDPRQLLASGLFGFPDLHIDERGSVEGDPEAALDVLLNTEPLPLNEALAKNIESGEISTAKHILDWLATEEDMNDGEVDSWSQRIRSALQEQLDSLRAEMDEVRGRLDLAFAQGQIEQEQRPDLEARLDSVERAARDETGVRFNREKSELDSVREELKAASQASLSEARAEAHATYPQADDPRRARIEQHIDDGDLVTAYELLHRSDEDHVTFADERSKQPSLLDAHGAIGRERLRELGKDWPNLRDSARQGERLGPLRFDRLDTNDRASAAALLDGWSALKRCRPTDRQAIGNAAQGLLSNLGGFLDVSVHVERASGEFASARMTASALRSRNDCPVPHFGSEANGNYRLLIFFRPPDAETMLQRLQQAGREATIAICVDPVGERTHMRLARLSNEQSLTLVTLDETLLIFLAAQPRSRLAAFFACALPFTWNQPFVPRAGRVPPEMFFGRETEARELQNFRGSCLVYGGRQLGKTALLRHVEREFMNPAEGRFAAWIDLKAEGVGEEHTSDIWIAMWRALQRIDAIDENTKPPTRRSVDAFRDALLRKFNRNSGKSLLLLFDEADRFLQRDAMNSSRETFAESTRLKSLMDADRSIKVVFAGLHNVVRTTTQSNHPLAHMGRPIGVGPFIEREERRFAHELLCAPLDACGYRFTPPRLATSVLARANYYPSLLQIYGATLVDRLSAPSGYTGSPVRAIGPDLLEALQRDRELGREIRQRFEWTLQLDPRYEAIAYTVAFACLENRELLRNGIGDDRILRYVRVWWPQGFEGSDRESEHFRALLDEMVELGVLRRTHGRTKRRRFSLRNPNVMSLLGRKDDIEERLGSFENRPASLEPGPFEIRRRHGDKGPLFRPLTLWQERRISGYGDSINRLARQQGNAVVLVCGTEAAGIANVAGFLQWGKERAEAILLEPTPGVAGFTQELKRRLDARGHETTLMIVPGEGWKEEWGNEALRLLRNLRSRDRFARVVFTLDPGQLIAHRDVVDTWLARGDADLVVLRPWDPGFAALCLEHDDPAVGKKLKAEDGIQLATNAGGWPILLELVVQRLQGGTEPSHLVKTSGFDELLSESADRLRTAFGLDLHALAETLRLLDAHGSADLDSLLDPETRDLIGCELSDNELQAALWAAEKLHLARASDEGEWRVDGVVSKFL
ncbi:MAG: hypothetical protein F4X59_09795 [Holophagales bacterium]|nr:hypothetical protein [Holophagales bacterium]MYC10407.1 hypothetical protein [Holophagales bacterium]